MLAMAAIANVFGASLDAADGEQAVKASATAAATAAAIGTRKNFLGFGLMILL